MSERFVIVLDGGDVSVLDTGHDLVEEEGNAELFNMDFFDEEDAKYVAHELEGIVCALNEQDRLMKENNIIL